MSAIWRGSRATQARIVTGLILYVYLLLHFLNIGLALVSPELAEAVQDVRRAITRSMVGSIVLYGALATHGVLSLGKLALRAHLRLGPADLLQAVLGLAIPLLLATHIVFTRASHEIFATNDTISYITALIWNTPSGWKQAALLLVMVIAFLGAAVGVHENYHLSVSAFRGAVPTWLRAVFVAATDVAMAGFGLLMLVYGARLTAFKWGSMIPLIQLPEGLRSLPLTVGGGLIVLFSLAHLVAP